MYNQQRQTTSKPTRVKACSECRQQKLRCDAATNTYSMACSRCQKLGLQCIVKGPVFRTKRPTKSDLQAEVEELRRKVQAPPDSMVLPNLSMLDASIDTCPTSSNGGEDSPAQSPSQPNIMHSAIDVTETQQDIPKPNSEITIPRELHDVHILGHEIDDCFALFFKRHLAHLPFIDASLTPNVCFNQSQLLFWTIVGIGSRKYAMNPTLITLLGPKIIGLVQAEMFSRSNVTLAIQACVLLCADPMPFEISSHDITHVLTGAITSMALDIGLHVPGVGQDFYRAQVAHDQKVVEQRAKLWFMCYVTCQRVFNTKGLPPYMFSGTWEQHHDWMSISQTLPPSVRFQQTLCYYHSDAILALNERLKFSESSTNDLETTDFLGAMIDEKLTKLMALETSCPSLIDRFYVMCAVIQIQSFCFYLPRAQMPHARLVKLHKLACDIAELTVRLDQQENFTENAPATALIYMQLTAFTILKLNRTQDINLNLDFMRGQRAYFSMIQMHKGAFVLRDDAWSRATTIMMQLWTSRKVFWSRNGIYDSLSLRCRNRYGMGVLYDTWWWWRCEFGGFPDPYDPSAPVVDNTSAENFEGQPVNPAEDAIFGWPMQWSTSPPDLVNLDMLESVL